LEDQEEKVSGQMRRADKDESNDNINRPYFGSLLESVTSSSENRQAQFQKVQVTLTLSIACEFLFLPQINE
jgi:hypothetical protein